MVVAPLLTHEIRFLRGNAISETVARMRTTFQECGKKT